MMAVGLAQNLAAIRALHRRDPFDLLHVHWIVPQGLVASLASAEEHGSPPLVVAEARTTPGGVPVPLELAPVLA